MADSLPSSGASVRVGSGASSRPASRPPPGAISFPPPLSPQAAAAAAASPNGASPGQLTPATQFTFRKGVHLPAIKSPPKVPGAGDVASPSAVGADDASPASHAMHAGSGMKGSPMEVAGAAAGSRGPRVDGDDEEDQYGPARPYASKPFVGAQPSAKVGPGPNGPGPEFMSPSSSEWADWHQKQDGSGSSGAAAAAAGSEGDRAIMGALPPHRPSVSQGQAIIELGSFDSERNTKGKDGSGAAGSGGGGAAAAKKGDGDDDEESFIETYRKHRTTIWLGVLLIALFFLGLLIAFGYFWGNNPEHYVSDEQVKTVAANEVAAKFLAGGGGSSDGNVTLGYRAVIGENIDFSTIQAENMADGSIGSAQLQANSVTRDKVDEASLEDFMLDVINGADLFKNVTSISAPSTSFALTSAYSILAKSGPDGSINLNAGKGGLNLATSSAEGGVKLSAGTGGITIDTLTVGSIDNREDHQGDTNWKTKAFNLETRNGVDVTADASDISLEAATGKINLQASTGVALATSTGDVTLSSTSGAVTASGASVSVQTTGGSGLSASAAQGVELSSAGALAVDAVGELSISSDAAAVVSANSVRINASEAVRVEAALFTVAAPLQNTVTVIDLTAAAAAATTDSTTGSSASSAADSSTGAADATASSTGAAAPSSSTGTTTTSTSYVIDFANLQSNVLSFTGTVAGTVHVTIANCNAAHSGIEVRLLNKLTSSSSANSLAILQLSRDTCSGVFTSTVTVGASGTIECVGPMPGAPEGQEASRVLCTRAYGSAAGISDFVANGTIGLTESVSTDWTMTAVANPGSVRINGTAGVIHLTLTARYASRRWGVQPGDNQFPRASFWLLNSAVTSAHAGVQLTLLQAGSTPPAGGPSELGAFVVTKQQLVPNVGILITATSVLGTTYQGEIITYLFSLV